MSERDELYDLMHEVRDDHVLCCCGDHIPLPTEREDRMRAALEKIMRCADEAWKPVQVFRSDDDVALDNARQEAWDAAADIARDAINDGGDRP